MPQLEQIAKVVVCDGEADTLEVLCEHLTLDHYEALPAPTGTDALRVCRFNAPDVLVLDLALPDMSGVDVLQRIREADGIDVRIDPNLAVIVLVGREGGGAGRDRSRELGADDYLLKPFAYGDLKARLAAVLRRRHNRRDAPIRVGGLVIDPGRRKVTVDGREVELARREFTLLRFLAEDPTRVFGKDELLRDVWGLRPPARRTRTLDSHASRLRKKLDPEDRRYVVNSWGIGYSLVAP